MNINRSRARESTGNRLRHLPSFFIIGPPRTGTTWLYEVLSKHTVLPSPTKETRFFDTHFHRGIHWYLAHFAPTEGKQVGEVAPTYFVSHHARERVARLIPQARVICIFRDPLERVLSLYRLKRAYGMIPWSFDEALRKDPELIESGKYATHLKEWLRVLGRDQVMPTFYDDLKGDPQAYLNKVADFISLPAFDISREENCNLHGSENMTHPRSYFLTKSTVKTADWLKARRLDYMVASFKKLRLVKFVLGGGTHFEHISQGSAARVYELFRPEIEELETILECDLSRWKLGRSDLDLQFAPLTEDRAYSSASRGQHLGSAVLCLESTKRSDHEIRLISPVSPQSPTVGSFASPFADFTARCFLRLWICIEVFREWKGTRMVKQNREVWWILRPGFRLPFRVSSWAAGGASCTIAAALATLLFYESSFKTILPLGFLSVIAGVAILFGRLAGIAGTVTTSLVFASVLFEPRPSLAVADPVAKSHLAWMAVIGLVISALMGRRKIAATPATRNSHGLPS
jgi:hypothetical protein